MEAAIVAVADALVPVEGASGMAMRAATVMLAAEYWRVRKQLGFWQPSSFERVA